MGCDKKKSFAVGVVKYWNMLPGEAVDAPSLKLFNGKLDDALSNLLQCKVSLSRAGILNKMIF